MTSKTSGATATQVQIPVCTPKNKAGKGFTEVLAFVKSFIAPDKQQDFVNNYASKMQTLPFELEGELSTTGGWYSFVIDLMCNAMSLHKNKGYSFVENGELAKICSIAFLGLLDMYEENTGRSRYYNQFYKFKDHSTSLFGCERTIAICSKYGIDLNEEEIECIFFTKNISNGEKMSIAHAGATARLFYSAYMLTKIDHQI